MNHADFCRLPVVHGEHDDARNPKGHRGRNNRIIVIHHENTRTGVIPPELLVSVRGVPPEEDGRERNKRRHEPHIHDHERDRASRHGDGVLEWTHDGVVAVHTDAAQVEDAHRAKVDVEGVPHIAHEVAEHPLSREFHRGVERHRAQCHEHVRERERHHVVVRDYTEFPVPEDADDDQGVAQHRAEDDGAHDEPAGHERAEGLTLEGGELGVRGGRACVEGQGGGGCVQHVQGGRGVRGHVAKHLLHPRPTL